MMKRRLDKWHNLYVQYVVMFMKEMLLLQNVQYVMLVLINSKKLKEN